MKLYAATAAVPPFGRPGSRSSFFKKTQKIDVYDAIVAAGKDGIGRHDIAKKINLAADRISFYLSDLRRAGFISVKGGAIDMTMMDDQESAFYAMDVLENALVQRCKKRGMDNEMRREFLRYNKVKALALGGLTGGEIEVAIQMSLIALVKLVFRRK